MNEKQQEFLHLCQQPDVKKYQLIGFYLKNCNDDHIFDLSLIHLCLLACCENDNKEEMLWIYETFLSTKPNKYEIQWNCDTESQMQKYMFILCCSMRNTNCLRKIKSGVFFILKIVELESCYHNAIQNNDVEILSLLSKWYPYYIHVFPNFNHQYNYYFIKFDNSKQLINQMRKQEKRKKQLFLLWITSNYSPNKDCFLYQLPREISRYLIQQFVD